MGSFHVGNTSGSRLIERVTSRVELTDYLIYVFECYPYVVLETVIRVEMREHLMFFQAKAFERSKGFTRTFQDIPCQVHGMVDPVLCHNSRSFLFHRGPAEPP